MRLFKLTLAAFLGVGLWACSNSDEPGQKNDNGTTEGDTWAAITIKYGDNGKTDSRANIGDDVDYSTAGETAESAIKTLRVIVAKDNGSSKEIEINSKIDISKLNSGKLNMKLNSGIRYFYVVINEDENLDNKTLSEIFSTTVNKKTAAITTGETGFLMTSVDEVKTTLLPNVSEGEAATKNPITIKVDRATAKATVITKNLNIIAEHVDKDKITNQTIEFTLGNADLDATTGAEGKIGFYRMQNHNDASTEWYTPYYGFTPDASSTHTVPSSYVKLSNDGTTYNPLYCLENTHAADNYKQGNTTYAAIRIPIVLKETLKFAVNGNDFSMTSTTNTGTNAESFYYITAPSTIRDQYILKSDLISLGGQLDNSLTTDDEKIAKAKTALTTKYSGFAWKGEYTDGIGYYRAWLNADNDYKTSPVFRNNWYELNIKNLTIPGDPKEPSIDPDAPLFVETNAEIAITIRNWRKVGHDINLE